MAVGVTRAGLIKKGKFINTALVVEMVDASLEIPLKPKSLDDWMIADGQLHSESMQSQFNGVKFYACPSFITSQGGLFDVRFFHCSDGNSQIF